RARRRRGRLLVFAAATRGVQGEALAGPPRSLRPRRERAASPRRRARRGAVRKLGRGSPARRACARSAAGGRARALPAGRGDADERRRPPPAVGARPEPRRPGPGKHRGSCRRGTGRGRARGGGPVLPDAGRAGGGGMTDAGPIRLAKAGRRYPLLLREIHGPPPTLYLRGAGPPQLLAAPAVAIVGARACSPYGAQVGRMLGRELAAAGIVVISGLARGVDGEAHRGALDAGGGTIAVLGCGVDRDYPAVHAQLARRICERGLVVSEYKP